MRRTAAVIATLTGSLGLAAADAPPARPRVLVLPLAPSAAVDTALARTFDARLLVALDDSRRVTTVTHDEEPECTTLPCLADLGEDTGAAYVLALSAVKEDSRLTLFGTLVDVKSRTAWRRIELPRVEPAALAKSAPAELVPQILGTPAGAPVLGFARPASAAGVEIARAIADEVAGLRAFDVVPLEAEGNRIPLTHRAELVIDDLSIAEPRRQLCTWYEGRLTGTFRVTELATGRVVFAKAVDVEAARRKHFSSRTEIQQLLVDRAVTQWVAAFRAHGVLKPKR